MFGLLVAEAGVLASLGVLVGVTLTYLLLMGGRPLLEQRFGILIALRPPSLPDTRILGLIVVAALFLGLVPAFCAYHSTLSDGLQMRT